MDVQNALNLCCHTNLTDYFPEDSFPEGDLKWYTSNLKSLMKGVETHVLYKQTYLSQVKSDFDGFCAEVSSEDLLKQLAVHISYMYDCMEPPLLITV
jgi:hypothetical protein